MVRQLKKQCDDYIIEALEIQEKIAEVRREITSLQHIRENHSEIWNSESRGGYIIIDEDGYTTEIPLGRYEFADEYPEARLIRETYLSDKQNELDSLRKRLLISKSGIHGTCVITR